MRDLLMAGALALALHALLFTLKPDWAKSKIPPGSTPEIITLTLAYKEAAIQTSPAARRIDSDGKPAPPQRVFQRKTERTTAAEPRSRLADKKADRPGAADQADKDILPDLLPSPDFEPGTPMGASGSSMTGAGMPSAQSGQGASTTASLPSPVRQAVPVYRDNPAPEYPPSARRRGHEGTVIAEALIGKDGRVHDLRLVQSSGYSVLDQAAMAAIRVWRFEPAMIGQEKVDLWVKVPVRFHLK